MHHRLPAVRPPMEISWNKGARSSENRRSVPSLAFSASMSATDLYLKKVAISHRGPGGRGQETESDKHRQEPSLFSLSTISWPLSADSCGGGSRKSRANTTSVMA